MLSNPETIPEVFATIAKKTEYASRILNNRIECLGYTFKSKVIQAGKVKG